MIFVIIEVELIKFIYRISLYRSVVSLHWNRFLKDSLTDCRQTLEGRIICYDVRQLQVEFQALACFYHSCFSKMCQSDINRCNIHPSFFKILCIIIIKKEAFTIPRVNISRVKLTSKSYPHVYVVTNSCQVYFISFACVYFTGKVIFCNT